MASTVLLSAILSVLILSVFAIKSSFKGIQREKPVSVVTSLYWQLY